MNKEASSDTQAAWFRGQAAAEPSAAGREEVLVLVEQHMVLVGLGGGPGAGATKP